MLSEIFLDLRNEAHFVIQALLRYPGLGISIFVHLVTDAYIYLFIYLFINSISFILFYFILFYFICYLFLTLAIFLLLFFFICFVIICPVPGCSGMFRNVPGCSGMFRNVPCSGFC